MARRCCLAIGAALAFVTFPAVSGAQPPQAPTLAVWFYPRATLHDAIDVCSDGGFPTSRSRAEALRIGQLVIDSLNIDAFATYDPGLNPACLAVHLRGPLTVAGARSHERILSLDSGPLDRVAISEGFAELIVHVCPPALPSKFDSASPRSDDLGCFRGGYGWRGALRGTVSFRATVRGLFWSILISLLFWLVVWTIGHWLCLVLNRRDRWDWFRKHQLTGLIALFLPVEIVGLGWGVEIAYEAGLVPSTQLILGWGIPGEVLLTTLPVAAFTFATARARQRGLKEIYRKYPDRAPAPRPSEPLKPLKVPLAPRAAVYPALLAMTFALPFATLFARSVIWRTPALVAAAALTIAIGTRIHDEVPVWAQKATRMNPVDEQAIVQRAGSIGLVLNQIWLSPQPIRWIGGASRAARFCSATAGDRIGLVWNTQVPRGPAFICGELMSSLGFSQYRIMSFFMCLIVSLVQLDPGHEDVSWWVVTGITVVIFLLVGRDWLRRMRVRRRAVLSPQSLDFVKGMLFAGRVGARASGASLPAFLTRRFPLLDPRAMTWTQHIKSVHGFSDRAGISAANFQAAVTEIEGTDERMDES